MDTKRQNKISRMIQKDISEIFQVDYRNFFGPVIITVTKVRVTSDLSLARINMSIFGTDNKDAVLQNIKKQTKEIRLKFSMRAKNQLRIMPVFEFYIDDSLDYIEKIDTLLKS